MICLMKLTLLQLHVPNSVSSSNERGQYDQTTKFSVFSHRPLVDLDVECLNPTLGSVWPVEGKLIVAVTLASFCHKLGGKLPTHNIEFYLHIISSMSSLGLPCVFHAS